MDYLQVRHHVVLPGELLQADGARKHLHVLLVGCHIVAAEVADVRIDARAYLAAEHVLPFLEAEVSHRLACLVHLLLVLQVEGSVPARRGQLRILQVSVVQFRGEELRGQSGHESPVRGELVEVIQGIVNVQAGELIEEVPGAGLGRVCQEFLVLWFEVFAYTNPVSCHRVALVRIPAGGRTVRDALGSVLVFDGVIEGIQQRTAFGRFRLHEAVLGGAVGVYVGGTVIGCI